MEWILNHLYLLAYTAVFFPMAAALVGWLIGRHHKSERDYFVFMCCSLELAIFLFLSVLTFGFSMERWRLFCGL